VKDKPAAVGSIDFDPVGNVFIICEGNFGSGTSSMYAYNKHKDIVSGDLYSNATKQPLGDVFQSMVKMNNQYFLCVNNSDKVVILNAGNLSVAGQINIPKPRYILPISETKAYISSEYSYNVYAINPQTHQVTDTIVLPHKNTEGMCLFGNIAVICTWDTLCNVIYKVDVGSNNIVHILGVDGFAPQEPLLDKDGMLWVLSGNQPQKRAGALTRLNPSSGDTLASYHFPGKADAIKPVFNPTRDTIYFIEADYYGGTANNGIYRMGIYESALPVTPFVAASAFQYFWALGVDPTTGHIYVGDPKGFIQKGTVYVYKPDGTQLKSFDVGIGPGHFYFDH
jgi:DNA-binding beta-propeller fold protein YncE